MQLKTKQHPGVVPESLKEWTIAPPPTIDPSQYELATKISNGQSQNFEPNGRSPIGSVKIGNRYCRTLIDTGSSITIVPRRLLSEIGGTRLPYVTAADGMSGPINIVAHITVDIEVLGYLVKRHECAVIEDSPALTGRETDALLGTDLSNKLPPILFNFQVGRIQLVPYDFQLTPPTKAVQVKQRRNGQGIQTNKSPKVISKTHEFNQDETLETLSVDPSTIDPNSTETREPTTHTSHPLF